MDLIYFILCSYGLTQILLYGHIFDRIRPDKRFFKCPMCIGFWVGLILYYINGYTDLYSFEYNLINPLLLGCLSSGTSYILGVIIGDRGIKYENN
tara:strand:- start:236 stop:520 length:285 start_codon:yes stop_codon:yes gene_type:complete